MKEGKKKKVGFLLHSMYHLNVCVGGKTITCDDEESGYTGLQKFSHSRKGQRLRVTESVKRETGQSERVRVKQKGLLFMQRKTGNHFSLGSTFVLFVLGL